MHPSRWTVLLILLLPCEPSCCIEKLPTAGTVGPCSLIMRCIYLRSKDRGLGNIFFGVFLAQPLLSWSLQRFHGRVGISASAAMSARYSTYECTNATYQATCMEASALICTLIVRSGMIYGLRPVREVYEERSRCFVNFHVYFVMAPLPSLNYWFLPPVGAREASLQSLLQ